MALWYIETDSSLYPSFAITFILSDLLPGEMKNKHLWSYHLAPSKKQGGLDGVTLTYGLMLRHGSFRNLAATTRTPEKNNVTNKIQLKRSWREQLKNLTRWCQRSNKTVNKIDQIQSLSSQYIRSLDLMVFPSWVTLWNEVGEVVSSFLTRKGRDAISHLNCIDHLQVPARMEEAFQAEATFPRVTREHCEAKMRLWKDPVGCCFRLS